MEDIEQKVSKFVQQKLISQVSAMLMCDFSQHKGRLQFCVSKKRLWISLKRYRGSTGRYFVEKNHNFSKCRTLDSASGDMKEGMAGFVFIRDQFLGYVKKITVNSCPSKR